MDVLEAAPAFAPQLAAVGLRKFRRASCSTGQRPLPTERDAFDLAEEQTLIEPAKSLSTVSGVHFGGNYPWQCALLSSGGLRAVALLSFLLVVY